MFDKKVLMLPVEIFTIAGLLLIVGFFSLVTAVRLGYVDPSVTAPLIQVQPASAATWDQRVGRLYASGKREWEFYCDTGYWRRAHLLIAGEDGNTNNAQWFTCVTGDWD